MATADEDLSRERFGFTIFLSVCFHAIVILGVSFTYFGKLNNNNALELTFAQHHSILPPDDVRFVTRESQNGDRAIDEALAPIKPFKLDFNNNLIQKVLPVPGVVDIANEAEMQNIAIISTSAGKDKINQQLEVLEPEKQQPASEESTSKKLSVAITSMQEQLNIRRQAYDKRPADTRFHQHLLKRAMTLSILTTGADASKQLAISTTPRRQGENKSMAA